jgi:hypothetical protein
MIAEYVQFPSFSHFRLDHIAMCEGNSIHSTIGIKLHECKKLCDMNRTCLSFSFCGNDNGTCNLKEKILHQSTQKVHRDNCTSHYKKCDGKLIPLFYRLYKV